MSHSSHISNTIRQRSKRLAHTAIVGVFSLSVAVTSGFALLTPAIALATPAAPTNVQAITGGNSIAVVWDPSAGSIKNYEVWRNSTKVATVTPGQGVLYGALKGNRYIDTSVTSGTAYQYQVKAVATDNSVSPLSATASATQPSAANTTPVPTITFDTSDSPDLANYMQTQIKPLLEAWYPKMGDAFARPDFTPPSSFTVKTDATMTSAQYGLTDINTRIIRVNPAYVRNDLVGDGGLLIHESSHIMQAAHSDPTGWLVESSADYMKDFFSQENSQQLPRPNDKITDAYHSGAFFLNWIRVHYDAAIVHKAFVAMNNNTLSTNFFTANTGKTDVQLWNEMRAPGNYWSSSAPIVGISTKCLTTQNGTAGDGIATQIAACNGSTAQQWGVRFNDIIAHDPTQGFSLINSSLNTTNNYCLDVAGSGTADGTQVWQYGCNEGGAQIWKTGANGSLINPQSGKCLQPAGGATTDGTGLVISTCNGSTAQNWKLWTTNSAIDQRYASDQTFRTNLGYPTVAETTSGIYTYKGYSNGRAYNTTRSGVHEVSGAIWTQYNATGAHTAWGEPTTDEKPTPDGVGRFNEFYGAGTSGVVSIYWSPSSNAHVIHGLIRDRWGVTGWEAGLHGYPTSDEAPTPNGLARFNNFQNGGIYWSSGTGAQSVWGAIYSRWGALGYENSFLGLPTTSELSTPDGVGRYNVFQSGSIYWSPSTGAWSVGGAIRDRWGQLGWETSYLGYPTSDEFSIAGGRRSNFQYGYITWNSSTGVVSDFHY